MADDDYADDELDAIRRADRHARWQRICPPQFADVDADRLDGDLGDAVGKWRTDPTRNLVLLGDIGVGKTHAACAAARLGNDAGWDARICDTGALLDSIRPGGDGDVDFQRARDCDVLVLDDIGVEKPSEWTAEKVWIIVNQRWLYLRPTIVTSNLEPAAVRDSIGGRSYDRLIDRAVTVVARGQSRRHPS